MRSSFVLPVVLALVACANPDPAEGGAETAAASVTSEQIVLPPGDDCASVVRPLAVAAAESYVGLARAKKVAVSLVSETEVREYEIFVDGPEFTVNGTTFPNDWTYVAVLDNDSSTKCLIDSFRRK